MIVGTLEPKTNKDGKAYFDLNMKIPFQKEQSFYVAANDKKTGENSPDLNIFLSGNKAGAIWKKKSNKGEDYLSGSVFCLGMPNNRLGFAVFKSKDEKLKDEKGNPVNLVVISEGERKDSDSFEEHAPETVF
ncbi:MAG: DUF736 family protein [Leptospiraceae bacterium]|nr:DUF736 family protein [Leptospiraceae bacterium]